MAFALSDLAAKNVCIESIFIDEGFGTLDPDTLDQAITILEKLQNEDDKYIDVSYSTNYTIVRNNEDPFEWEFYKTFPKGNKESSNIETIINIH